MFIIIRSRGYNLSKAYYSFFFNLESPKEIVFQKSTILLSIK